MSSTVGVITKGKISDEQFKFLSQYLGTRYGLRVPPEKRILLESRLISRLNSLRMQTIEQYLDYTFNSKAPNDEYQFFIDQITTHKTFFLPRELSVRFSFK